MKLESVRQKYGMRDKGIGQGVSLLIEYVCVYLRDRFVVMCPRGINVGLSGSGSVARW